MILKGLPSQITNIGKIHYLKNNSNTLHLFDIVFISGPSGLILLKSFRNICSGKICRRYFQNICFKIMDNKRTDAAEILGHFGDIADLSLENLFNRPVSQIRAPPGGLSRTSGKL